MSVTIFNVLSTMKYSTLIFTALLWQYTEGYKILVMFPFPGKSHSILGEGVVRHLSNAGHEVTYVTAFPNDEPAARVTEIDISSNKKLMPDSQLNFKDILDKKTDVQSISSFIGIMLNITSKTLEHEAVQKVLKNENFDAVIVEWMFGDLYTGLGALFQCPFIWLSSVEPHWMILKLIDEMPNPAYNAAAISGNLPPFNFKQRVQELGFQIFGEILQYFYKSDTELKDYLRILAPIIRDRGHNVPTLEEVKYNASLVLGNSHVSIGRPTRLPPSYKSVGGFHIKTDVKPLPTDLKKLLDNAKNGFIYFSMGSNLKSKNMPDELKQSLLKMFASLKQIVLWKFEEDLPNTPSNVHILHWAPQQSILNHPNCLLFITHGGLLSLTETIFFGKPIIAIPVFADQFGNADRAVSKGFAKRVDLSYDMARDIKIAIDEMISNPKYLNRAKELSVIYHDRPVPPGKELVHWVEHVIKTNGAAHLRSLAVDLPLYQKLYLDLLAIVIVGLYMLKMLIKKAFSMIFGKKNVNIDKKNKKKTS